MEHENSREYIKRRKKLSGLFFETALPNEYLIEIGRKDIKPVLGGKKFRMFKKYLRIPASVQTIHFTTDNANIDYQGIGVEGYASWRIDPVNPKTAVTTLDFFDEDDPMERTNRELCTICIEAVRHVIANMTIDDAMRKKDEIAENLKNQLKEIEKKWGIIFDQVGIEKVTLMSGKLFENLQAQFRDQLRLEVEKKRIATDQSIATEENGMKEKTELQKLDTEKKLETTKLDNKSNLKEQEIERQNGISLKEREIRENDYRKEMAFNQEKQQKEYDLSLLEKNLTIKLLEVELEKLKSQKESEIIQGEISKMKLELTRLQKDIDQVYSNDSLTNVLIEKLPDIFKSIKIDNYSILDGGGNGSISPVGKILNEILFLIKQSDLASIFNKDENNNKKSNEK